MPAPPSSMPRSLKARNANLRRPCKVLLDAGRRDPGQFPVPTTNPRPLVQTSRPSLGESESRAVAACSRRATSAWDPRRGRSRKSSGLFVGGGRTVLCVNTVAARCTSRWPRSASAPETKCLFHLLLSSPRSRLWRLPARGRRLRRGRSRRTDRPRRRAPPPYLRTRAIMPVHYAGYAGAIAPLRRFAHQHGLRVIEDAAHAFGAGICRARR